MHIPSFENGYAPRDGEPLYPELFRGLVSAWCPSLGVTGSTLRDLSGRNNHGTASTFTVWNTSNGKTALDFSGNEFVSTQNVLTSITSGAMAVSAWVFPRFVTEVRQICGDYRYVDNTATFGLEIGRTSGLIGWLQNSGTAIYSTLAIPANQWSHVLVSRSGMTGSWSLMFSRDGQTQTITTTQNPNITSAPIAIASTGTSPFQRFHGLISDVAIWQRSLSLNEIQRLYSLGRGGMFTMRPPRKYFLFKPDIFKSRKTQLITTKPETPSFEAGFAPRDGEPLYPEFHRGLVGAWCPSLGVTGGVLRDLSGRNNHGTLTNMDPATDWVVSDGQYALDFDGTDDYVVAGSIPNTQQLTIEGWIRTTANTRSGIITIGTFWAGVYIDVLASGVLRAAIESSSTDYIFRDSSVTISNGVWTHIAMTATPVAVDLFVNGVNVTTGGGTSGTLTQILGGVVKWANGFSNPYGGYLVGQLDSFTISHAVRSNREIQRLYQLGRGGIFTLKPTRKFSLFDPPKVTQARQVTVRHEVPSFENGFAPRDGEPLYPNLFKGLVGAWCPSMGVTGGTLRDLSGRNNHGTLTNMDNATDWVVSDGQYALDFDGSNDYLLLPQSIALPLPAAISLWFQHTTTSVFILSEPDNANNNAQLLGFGGQIAMGLTNVGAAQITGPVVNDGKWHHVMAVWAATNDRRLYVDGKLVGTSTFDNATNFAVSYFCARSQSSLFYQGKLDDIKVWSIAPNANSVRLEYQLGRGGMFAMKPRKISSSSPARIPKSRASLISRPPIEASYENGFAPRDGEPLYPNLFKGLIGAWVPSLGVTGRTLRDVSGRNNHGTLTNMDPASDWVIDGGQYALNFDGINNEIVCSNNTAMDQLTAGTVSVWYRPATTSGLQAILTQWNVNSPQAGIFLFQNDAALAWQVGSISDRRITASAVFAASQWVHLVATFSVSAMQIIVNGQLRTTGAAPSLGVANSRGVPTRIGYGDGGPGFAKGLIDDATVWSRSLSLNEALQLYQLGRGGMFRLSQPPQKKTISLPSTWLKVDNEWTEVQPSVVTASKASLITRPPIEPSYENGFAPRDGEPLYPNLFKGLVGAWCPSMGVTGNTLRDLSGRNNHGTLTNMDPATDWVIDGGQYALDLDGSNDRINVGNITLPSAKTFSLWLKLRALNTVLLSVSRSGAPAGYFAYVDANNFIYNRNEGTFFFASLSLSLNVWTHLVLSSDGSTYTVYVDGVQRATMQDAGATRLRDIGAYDTNEYSVNGQIDDITVWGRALRQNNVRQLYQLGRGGLFTLKPKTIALPTSSIWQPSQSRLYTGEWK